MRVVEIVVVAMLASSCGHVAPVINHDTDSGPGVCGIEDKCAGGSGAADTAMTLVAASAILGILAMAIVSRITSE